MKSVLIRVHLWLKKEESISVHTCYQWLLKMKAYRLKPWLIIMLRFQLCTTRQRKKGGGWEA